MKKKFNLPKFVSSVVLVKDIKRSKNFYTNVLGQKITIDFGRNVGFEGGFVIWEKEYALNTIFEGRAKEIKTGGNNLELYFEYDELEELIQTLKKEKIRIIHPIREHPWGQRGFRLYDPDNHIIEISEPMANVVIRMFNEGMSEEEIQKKSLMPKEVIEEIISNM
ncbi:MAG: hypothetical protein GF383_02605 [Candidatus Lokiarchaeota archaeon]|nr:hypothetical protein [Candidatus Lokiarchaeota archaeon]MBD3338323.1 hypothetical protein [Candidatus Lokiarchaeota archaeon]